MPTLVVEERDIVKTHLSLNPQDLALGRPGASHNLGLLRKMLMVTRRMGQGRADMDDLQTVVLDPRLTTGGPA